MPLRTPLYDWHVSRGARLVEFGGWDMPVQYTSIIEEHTAVRTAAGFFDVSHMGRLSFAGPGALDLIQHVWTNDAASMQDFQVRYGLLCNERGGVRDDVLVYRWPRSPVAGAPGLCQDWAMVVNASNRPKIVDWLAEHQQGRDVQVTDQTEQTCMIAVQGPRAIEWFAGLTEADPGKLGYYRAAATRCQGQNCVVSRTGYTGEDGVEIVLPASLAAGLCDELVARRVRPCGLGARDTLRLEAAMPLYGHELTEDIDPLQAGLSWAVKLDKGPFVGREALLERCKDTARPVRVGLELEGKRIAREGAAVARAGRPVGRVASGTFAPTLQKVIAMAYLDPVCAAPGTAVTVDVRGREESAKVVPLPFYRRPKK
jgi:aminomethyltransferase